MSRKSREKEPTGKGRGRRIRRSVLFVAIALIAVAAVAAALLYSMSTPSPPWLFKGAYGVYQGNFTSLNESYGITSRLEVTDFNSTTATFAQSIIMSFANGTQSQQYNVTSYYDLQGKHFIVNNDILNKTYGEDVNYKNSERPCLVYEYVAIYTDNTIGIIHVYHDNATGWILGQKNYSADFNTTLNLVETNIPTLG